MLKIKDIINMIKDLYNSNLVIENIFDVLITTGVFSLCCNFLSKIGLSFVVVSGILYLFNVSTGIVLLTLFAPSILILANVPVVYTINMIKGIKKYNLKTVDAVSSVDIINKNVSGVKTNFNYSNNYSSYRNKNLTRVRKR